MKKRILTAIGLFFLLTVWVIPVQAKKSKMPADWIQTNPTNSYVILNKDAKYLTSKNKATKKLIKKGSGVRIYYLRFGSKNKVYYANKAKQWLPASSTRGNVWYHQKNGGQMVITTDKKGKLKYNVYAHNNITKVVLIKNAYQYNSKGMLASSKMLKKGTHLNVYAKKKIGKTSYYVTNHGWINVANAKVLK